MLDDECAISQPGHNTGGTATVVSQVWRASTGTARGQLPGRYDEWWHPEYFARVEACFRPGISILDIGAGRSPTIPPGDRPIGCRYVGLDLSQAELEKAPAGGYDQTIAADATRRIPSIEASFDLVLSYLVLEHVADLPKALDNIRSYLVPNGEPCWPIQRPRMLLKEGKESSVRN